jgi:hypothetical protein
MVFFTHRSVSTFDRSPFQLTDELFLYGTTLSFCTSSSSRPFEAKRRVVVPPRLPRAPQSANARRTPARIPRRPPAARARSRRRRARPRRGRVAAVVDDAASAEASDS